MLDICIENCPHFNITYLKFRKLLALINIQIKHKQNKILYEIENLYSNLNCFLKNKDRRSSKFASNPQTNLHILQKMQVNSVTTSLHFEGQTCIICFSQNTWDTISIIKYQGPCPVIIKIRRICSFPLQRFEQKSNKE